MAFNMQKTSSSFIPYCKYNAKSGRWYTKTDSGDEYEVSNMTAIFDLENIRSGWFLFTEGIAPDVLWDVTEDIPAPPTTNHKRGFAVNVYSPKELGGVREFSSTSNTVCNVVQDLWTAFGNAPERNKGMVPVVKCENIIPVKSNFGTNYQPVLVITRWVPRPDALPQASSDSAPRRPAPAAVNDTPPFDEGEVPPPVNRGAAPQPAAARQPAMADEEEF